MSTDVTDITDIWNSLSYKAKLITLSNASSVDIHLLLENDDLVQMVKRGEPMASCLHFINENW